MRRCSATGGGGVPDRFRRSCVHRCGRLPVQDRGADRTPRFLFDRGMRAPCLARYSPAGVGKKSMANRLLQTGRRVRSFLPLSLSRCWIYGLLGDLAGIAPLLLLRQKIPVPVQETPPLFLLTRGSVTSAFSGMISASLYLLRRHGASRRCPDRRVPVHESRIQGD